VANEKRLIDANALKANFVVLGEFVKDLWHDGTIRGAIDNAPTVDAVEVVRCKDCVHSIWDEENEMWKCIESAEYDPNFGDYMGWVSYHNADYYCAYGERKDNG
jgi:hypothetical protein